MYSFLSVMTIYNNFSGFTVFLRWAPMTFSTLQNHVMDSDTWYIHVHVRLHRHGQTAESTDRLRVSRLI